MKLHPIPQGNSTLRIPFWIIAYLCIVAVGVGLAALAMEHPEIFVGDTNPIGERQARDM